MREPLVASYEALKAHERNHDAASTIALFRQIEAACPKASTITVFCDNARSYRSKAVRAYLEQSRIALRFLPAYAPKLHLIERLWQFSNAKCSKTVTTSTLRTTGAPCKQFFADLDQHTNRLRSLLDDNFEVVRVQ